MNTTISERKASTDKTSKFTNILKGEGFLDIFIVGISVTTILVILFG